MGVTHGPQRRIQPGRRRLHSRFGNIPTGVLDDAAELFRTAINDAKAALRGFTDAFWSRWDDAYRELSRERPESAAADPSARAVPQVLRLALIYSVFDGANEIDTAMARVPPADQPAAVARRSSLGIGAICRGG